MKFNKYINNKKNNQDHNQIINQDKIIKMLQELFHKKIQLI